ncbi:hypothetical protein [Photobacterium leiognathi]|uniref:hypothetical protein n=1 Tax=Photobacterium leiognathi TaxID=553611 RepID=UPI002735E430|nr:hypothetical protein [Photobacterium leiognathi]
MKKTILASLLLFTATTTFASPSYHSEQEMAEDVSLLAQASLIYKQTGDQRLYDSAHRMCKVLSTRYKGTISPSSRMMKWKSKVDMICSDY